MIAHDHLGNEYVSVREMCKHYGLSENLYFVRIKRGSSVEEALTRPIYSREVEDGDGNSFQSITEMCRKHGVSQTTFRKRIKKGISATEALIPTNQCRRNATNSRWKDKTGECRVMNCGLYASIIRYENAQNVDVQFEDGTIRTNAHYSNFCKGQIKHPVLGHKKRCTWKGMDIRPLLDSNGKNSVKCRGISLYHCICQSCGYEDILTPQEILEHYSICNTMGENL